MNAKSVSKIALRVLAVFFIFEGIGNLPMLAGSISHYGSTVAFKWVPLWESTVLIAPIVLGVIVWSFAERIANWMVNRTDTGEPAVQLDASNFQTIAFVTLGIFFLIQCVPNIAGIVYMSLTVSVAQQLPPLWQNLYFVEEILKLVLAAILVLRARFLTQLFVRLREFGLNQQSR